MDVILRRAILDDAAGIVRCIDAAYAPYLSAGLKLPAVSEGVGGDIQNNLVWVLESSQRIVGCLIVVAADDIWHLANIAVHPDFSGQGLGKRLIGTCVDAAKAAGAHHIRLATHADMPSNVALYTRLGWVVTQQGDIRIQMSRPINITDT